MGNTEDDYQKNDTGFLERYFGTHSLATDPR